MYKYKDQKEMRIALNGKMINMMVGIFLLVNAITGSIRYAANFSGIALGYQDGVQKYVDLLAEAGTTVGKLWIAAAAFVIVAIAEVFVGMLAVRLANRLDKAAMIKKGAMILLVLEVMLHTVLFMIGLPYISIIFNSVFLPGALIWSSSGLKKLSVRYPDRIYATEPRKKPGKAPISDKQKKSIMERAKTTVNEDNENE